MVPSPKTIAAYPQARFQSSAIMILRGEKELAGQDSAVEIIKWREVLDKFYG